MLTMTSYIQDYVLENAEVFNEFDRSSFISNAAIALDKMSTNLQLSIKGNQYSHFLNKSISHINSIEIESYAVSEFITKILNSGRIDSANLIMRDITKTEAIIMKPQYLTEAVLDYKEVINGIASGKYGVDKIKGLYANVDNYIVALKKRLVSSNINVNITPKEMIKYNNFDKVKVTTRYLEDNIIPFLQDIPKKKKELCAELSNVSAIVDATLSELKRITEDVSTGISLNKVDDVQKKLMLQFTFNQVRAILEGVSFITYSAMRKAHQFEDCITECQNVYNQLTLIFHDAMNIIEAGTFDNKIISATDANNMAEKLVDGSNDVFVELSNNIMEYHKGYISSHLPNSVDVSGGDVEDYVTTLLSKDEFDPTIYHNIVKCYIEIGNGLDILAKNCDDYLIIFDELLQKAGFVVSLSDRFHNEIEALDDLSVYGITDIEVDNSIKRDIYYKILAEINDYPNLTSQIARSCKAIMSKAEYVEDLFNHKKNGELAYSETMNELRIFIESFRDQFKVMNTSIVKGLWLRLKSLAAKADDCLDTEYTTPEDTYYNDDDFFREAVLANLEEIDTTNDMIMEVLLKEYYAERELKERGVRLIYEAENTSVKVVDNAANSGTTTSVGTGNKISKDKLSNLMKSIGEWFEKMINSFEDIIGRQAAKNTKWLADNKEGLINRSYSNVEIQILPYDKMPTTQITGDIGKLTTNVGTMNVQNMQGINTYEDLRTKLINFGPKFSKEEEKVTLTNYYKVGKGPMQAISYANSDIKTIVVNNMIPYCENFYSGYKEEIKKQLTALKDATTNITKTYVTESVNDIITEAEVQVTQTAQPAAKPATTTTATPQNNNQTKPTVTDNTNKADNGLAAKAGWIRQCIQVYSGSVLNAIRDRNNDYFKVLYALAPKAAATNVEVKTSTTETNAEQPAENNQTK